MHFSPDPDVDLVLLDSNVLREESHLWSHCKSTNTPRNMCVARMELIHSTKKCFYIISTVTDSNPEEDDVHNTTV